MRVFATVLLSISLAASPMFAAEPANDPGKTDTPAAGTAAAGPVAQPAEAAKAETSVIEGQLQDLRSLIEAQTQEIEEQRAALKAEQLKMEALEERLHSNPALVPVSSSSPNASVATASVGVPVVRAASVASPAQAQKESVSPLSFSIGGAQFFPLGFMDLTNVYRSTTVGTGIGTSFNSIPFSNSVLGRISEDRFSAQNSRIGFRTQAKFGNADVTGYLEADFLGFLAPNGFDTSNSDSLRMRLYWVDYKNGMFEMLGGQSWSLLTPNRNGLSALPGDLFYSQDVDTNYQLGLTWARQAGVRFIMHPNKAWAIGLSLENPQQTLPGSVVLPTNALIGTVNYGNQFDTNSSNPSVSQNIANTSVPNMHPDVILKTSIDGMAGGSHHYHFDVAGLFRTFNVVNTLASGSTSNLTDANTVKSTIHGGGIAATENFEIVKNLRLIATQFYSYGGGRYIASTAGPDVIVRPNGTLSGVRSGSGIGGFEYQVNPNLLVFGYYSGAYFGKNFDITGSGASTTFTGYGFQAAGSSGNRYFYEATFGAHQYLWRNPNYGDIRLMTQYSYSSRAPWFVNNTSQLATAHNSMVYVNLRYDIP